MWAVFVFMFIMLIKKTCSLSTVFCVIVHDLDAYSNTAFTLELNIFFYFRYPSNYLQLAQLVHIIIIIIIDIFEVA